MRILHITETVKGGVGNYMFDLACHQIEQDQVTAVGVAVPQDFSDLVPDALQGSLFALPEKRRSAVTLLRMAMKIRTIIKQFQPDMLFLHSTFAGVLARAPFLVFGKPCRVIFVPHSWSFQMSSGQSQASRPSLKSRVYAGIERMLLTKTDAVLCVAQEEVEDAKVAGLNTAKCHAILTGLKDVPSHLKAAKESQPDVSRVRAIFVGRFGEQKGSDLLVEAARQLDPDKVVLDVLGEGDPDNQDAEHLAKLANVNLHGWVSRERAHELIAQADVLFMPSRWEGLPLTTVEAMRASTAMLTSSIQVLKRIVERHDCGVVGQGAQDFADLLNQTDKSQWRRWGVNARQAYETHYRFEQMARQVDDLAGISAD